MRRGIALSVVTFVISASLVGIALHSLGLAEQRIELARITMEERLILSEIEVIRRIAIVDLLGTIDEALSMGRLYPIDDDPKTIMSLILEGWSLMVSSRIFGMETDVSILPGAISDIVLCDFNGFPMTLTISYRFKARSGLTMLSKVETFSIRHSARIERAKELALRYRDKAIRLALRAKAENETISYVISKMYEYFLIKMKVKGSFPEYAYYVEVRDLTLAAILDRRLNYGFQDYGFI
jgi:hypothetical protein